MKQLGRVGWLGLLAALSSAACSGDEGGSAKPTSDAGVDAAADGAVDPCPAHCELLKDCGATPSDVDCAALCEGGLPEAPVYSESCRGCIDGRCEQIGTCVQDEQRCGAPSVEVMLSIDSLPPGADTQVRMTLWGGAPLVATSSKEVGEQGVAVLSLGRAGHPGLGYRLRYFTDADGDGVCQPGVDITGEGEVFIEEPLSLIYAMVGAPPEADLCAEFPSKQALCQTRCDEAARCGSAEAGAGCVEWCRAEPTRPTLDCLACQAGRSCAEQALACQQPGGACEVGYVPPDVTLLIATGEEMFPDEDGRAVYAKVRNSAGRLLAEGPEVVIQDGGFFMNFGEIVWQEQTYTVTFFIDRDGEGSCGSGDLVYDLDVTVEGNTVLHYAIFARDRLTDSSCERYDAP